MAKFLGRFYIKGDCHWLEYASGDFFESCLAAQSKSSLQQQAMGLKIISIKYRLKHQSLPTSDESRFISDSQVNSMFFSLAKEM